MRKNKAKTHIDIITALKEEGPLSWTQLMNKADIASATLSRNLNDLMDEGIIKKEIDKDNNVVYRAKKTKKEILSFIKQNIDIDKMVKQYDIGLKNYKKFSEKGLFSNGINKEDIIEFLEESKNLTASKDNLIPAELLHFTRQLSLLMSLADCNGADVEVKLKVNLDKDKCLDNLKKGKKKYQKLKK